MIDLKTFPVIDHHSHVLDPKKAVLEPALLAKEFFHGRGDIPNARPPREWGASEELRSNLRQMGVVNTMVCQLSRVLDCPAELDAVASERNRRTARDFAGYCQLLYQDAKIVATVIDSELPNNDPLLDLIPKTKLRLFQFDPALQKLLAKSESYQALLRSFQETLAESVRKDGFIGERWFWHDARLGRRTPLNFPPGQSRKRRCL
jgi:hypothetical protein